MMDLSMSDNPLTQWLCHKELRRIEDIRMETHENLLYRNQCSGCYVFLQREKSKTRIDHGRKSGNRCDNHHNNCGGRICWTHAIWFPSGIFWKHSQDSNDCFSIRTV